MIQENAKHFKLLETQRGRAAYPLALAKINRLEIAMGIPYSQIDPPDKLQDVLQENSRNYRIASAMVIE